MFERGGGTGPGRPQRRVRRPLVAREEAPAYVAGAADGAAAVPASGAPGATARPGPGARSEPVPGLAEALAVVDAALDVLVAVELDGEDARAVLDATVVVQRQANRLAAAQLTLLGRADASAAYLEDGAVSLASWLRPRTRLDAGECTRRVSAGARLWRFPQLAAAARAGDVTLGHVTAITSAAVPRRAAAVAAHDATLTLLARHAPPRDVRVALGRIAEHADRDATDRPPEPFDGRDPRCALWVRPGIDGLGDLQATLSQLDTEGLLTLLDALEVPDPPDIPAERRRSPAQRRADAFGELIRRALAHGLAPTVHGVKPQVLLALDLAALLPAAQRGELDLTDLLAAAGIDEEMLRAAGVDPDTLHPTPTHDDDPSATTIDRGADSSHDDDDRSEGAQDDAGDPTSGPTNGNAPDDTGDATGEPTVRSAQDDTSDRTSNPTGARTGDPTGGDPTGGDPTGGDPGGVHDPSAAPPSSPSPPPDPLTNPPPEPPPPVRPRARLRFTGDLDLGTARHLLLHDATVRCVLTMGPWRSVAVGRAFRALPAWLRPLLDLVHQRCRGPDCDRPIPWADVHHLKAWSEDGETGVNESIPVCRRHHTLVTTGGWRVRFDPDTGVVTWTSPTGRVYHSRPPP